MDEQKPWLTEPNFMWWCDIETKAECYIVRNAHFLHLCGYVRIMPSHPFYNVKYSDPWPEPLLALREWLTKQEFGKRSIVDLFCAANGDVTSRVGLLVDVHGGVTFSDEIRQHEGWWWGFDCGHAYDLQPGMPDIAEVFRGDPLMDKLRELFETLREPDRPNVYRTFEYVQREVESMARQLRAIETAAKFEELDAEFAAAEVISKAAAEQKAE